MREPVPHGEASSYLAAGVLFLNEEERVFEAMLEGWSAQQIGGRTLQISSVRKRANTVRRFHRFTNEWPWQWSASAFDEWMSDLVAVQHLAPSTIRNYQEGVRLFCAYLCSEHYGWRQLVWIASARIQFRSATSGTPHPIFRTTREGLPAGH